MRADPVSRVLRDAGSPPAATGPSGRRNAKEAETPEGKYFYCVIRSPEYRSFATKGLGDRGDCVETMNYEDLAAVVSDSPVVEYENNRRNMRLHMRVLEEVMSEFSLLPARFGSVAPGAKAVREGLLKGRHDVLAASLREMEGRVEMGLKAFWYEDAIFREIVDENPEIRRRRDALVGRAAEETYYDRIRVGEMVEAAMLARRKKDADRILARFRPLARETRVNDTLTERMVLNAAFLVDRAREAEFDATVKELDAEIGGRLLLKSVGPVPPYNFVDLSLPWEEGS